MGAENEGHIHAPLGHCLAQFAGAAFFQHQAHLRRAFPEAPDNRRHERMKRGGSREADGQPAGFAHRHAAHAVHRLVHHRDDVAGIVQQRAAAFGEFHAARQAVEQGDAQLLFQHADLLA
ncbi:hypothetical protein D3C72_2013760 [compost metagenome]